MSITEILNFRLIFSLLVKAKMTTIALLRYWGAIVVKAADADRLFRDGEGFLKAFLPLADAAADAQTAENDQRGLPTPVAGEENGRPTVRHRLGGKPVDPK